jgi:proteasome lid subunit RPN8/RPN11
MLKLNRNLFDAIRRHGEDTYPHECCGVLVGRMLDDNVRVVTEAIRTSNTRTDSPQNRYHIDPAELLPILRQSRERGEEIVGFYHSHPDHPAHWSSTDLAEAHWIGCSYVITSVNQGQAADTNSFELIGSGEEDKRLVPEPLDNGSLG